MVDFISVILKSFFIPLAKSVLFLRLFIILLYNQYPPTQHIIKGNIKNGIPSESSKANADIENNRAAQIIKNTM
ncbi:hypothetical protein IKO18_06110 [bacterium]|nr:hypothetical protein [bacterium]